MKMKLNQTQKHQTQIQAKKFNSNDGPVLKINS